MSFDPVALVERAFAPARPGVEAWLDEIGSGVIDAVAPEGVGGVVWLEGAPPRPLRAAVCDLNDNEPPWALPGLSTVRASGVEIRWVVTAVGPHRAAFAAVSARLVCSDDARQRLWRYLAVHLAYGLLEAVGHRMRGRPLGEAAHDLAVWRRVLSGRWRFVERRAAAGGVHVVAEELPRGEVGLTQRQRQVAFYASLGCSNKEVGYHLGLAENTVSAHLQRAMEKMGISSRTELVRVAGRVTAGAEVALMASPRTSGVLRR